MTSFTWPTTAWYLSRSYCPQVHSISGWAFFFINGVWALPLSIFDWPLDTRYLILLLILPWVGAVHFPLRERPFDRPLDTRLFRILPWVDTIHFPQRKQKLQRSDTIFINGVWALPLSIFDWPLDTRYLILFLILPWVDTVHFPPGKQKLQRNDTIFIFSFWLVAS